MNYTDKLVCCSQYEQMGLPCQAENTLPDLQPSAFTPAARLPGNEKPLGGSNHLVNRN